MVPSDDAPAYPIPCECCDGACTDMFMLVVCDDGGIVTKYCIVWEWVPADLRWVPRPGYGFSNCAACNLSGFPAYLYYDPGTASFTISIPDSPTDPTMTVYARSGDPPFPYNASNSCVPCVTTPYPDYYFHAPGATFNDCQGPGFPAPPDRTMQVYLWICDPCTRADNDLAYTVEE